MGRDFLVLGSTGMLGQALMAELNRRGENPVGLARKDADFCVDLTQDSALLAVVEKVNPAVVINAAAWVDLAWCEENPDQSYLVNTKVSGLLANQPAKYVYISTDHYYSGDGARKHTEEDPVNPCNEYARTKYLGERLALLNEEALVVRTNIVGFRGWPNRPTFLEWVVSVLEGFERFIMFTDFYTSSLDVTTFSKALYDLIDKNVSGVVNLASSEVASKQQFIEALASSLDLSTAHGKLGSMLETLTGLPRNESLGLDVTKAERILGYALPDLEAVVNQLTEEYEK